MLIDELVEYALQKASGKKVTEVRAGLGYTGVMLEDRSCGLAYTFRNELGNCCGIIGEAGSLIGKACTELIPWAGSGNLLKAAIGLAAVNSVLNDPRNIWGKGNVTTAFDLVPSDTFGMVGEFKPILKEIRNKTDKVFVFEKNMDKGSGLHAEDTMPLHLPKCDVVVITATSIINHTIDGVLANCKNAREVCLVGPSTPLCMDLLKHFGVTLLAGSVVKNPELVLQIISQGGGTISMKPAIDQVLVRH